MKFSSLKLKNSCVLSKKCFLIFQEGTCKARKTNIFYISGGNFPSSKKKKKNPL